MAEAKIFIISSHPGLEEVARQLFANVDIATLPSRGQTEAFPQEIIDNPSEIIACHHGAVCGSLAKPMVLAEFASLIQKCFAPVPSSQTEGVAIGHFTFMPLAKTLLYQGDVSVDIRLTEKEVALIQALYDAGGMVEKEILLADTWGYQEGVDTHTLETHIYRLRQKIAEHCQEEFILTEANGYRLCR